MEGLEINTTPEKNGGARREQRNELIANRFEIAIQAYDLEKMLVGKATKEEVDAFLAQLPKERRVRLSWIASDYREFTEKAKSWQRTIDKYCVGHNLAEANSQILGGMIFEDNTGEKPKGEVTLEIMDMYPLIIFANEEDYVTFRAKGMDADEEKAKQSGGVFCKARTIKYFGYENYTVPLILVSSEKNIEKTLLHERQHAINHGLLNLFETTEIGKDSGISNEEKEARNGIKDEVVSYVRGGQSGESLVEVMSSPLYEHLFNDLRDRTEAIKIISRTGDFLEENWGVFRQSPVRAILANELAMIPFGKILHWLEAMSRSIKEKEALPLDKKIKYFYFDEGKDTLLRLLGTHLTQRYISKLPTAKATFKMLLEEEETLRNAWEITKISGCSVDDPKVLYIRDRFNQLQEEMGLLLDSFKEDGHLPVRGNWSDKMILLSGEWEEEELKEQKEKMTKAKTALIEEFSTWPVEDFAKIYDNLEANELPERVRAINLIMTTLNQNFPQVEISISFHKKTFTEEKALLIYVDYSLTPEAGLADNKNRKMEDKLTIDCPAK